MAGPEWSPVKACRCDRNGQIISLSKYSLCSTAASRLRLSVVARWKVSFEHYVNSPKLDIIVFSVKTCLGGGEKGAIFLLHTHRPCLLSMFTSSSVDVVPTGVCDFSTSHQIRYCFYCLLTVRWQFWKNCGQERETASCQICREPLTVGLLWGPRLYTINMD